MIKCIYVIWCLCGNLLWVSSTRFEGFNEWCILWWKGRRKGLRRKVLALEFPSQPPFYNSFVLSPTISIHGTFFWCGRHWKVYAGTGKHHWAVIFDVLRNLVPFVQIKKREKHPWRSVTFSKVAGFCLKVTKGNTPLWVFSKFFKLYKWFQIAQLTNQNHTISINNQAGPGKNYLILNFTMKG